MHRLLYYCTTYSFFQYFLRRTPAYNTSFLIFNRYRILETTTRHNAASSIHLQVLVEPHNSLAEGLLLGELEVLVAEIGTDSKAVGDAAEKVDLPVLAGLDEDALRLVTELSGEDLVDLCRRDG